MRKEVFFAICAGITAGLMLAFGAWKLSQSFRKDTGPASTSAGQPTPQNKPQDLNLSIASPDNFSVLTSSTVNISGITKDDAIVVILTGNKDYITTSQKDGSFSQEIGLDAGINQIVIKVFEKDGKEIEKNLKLVYSKEFEKFLTSEENLEKENEKESSDEGESIREKVQQKLDATVKKSIAYAGSVTDISQGSIQIKSEDNGIQQIATNSDTENASDNEIAIGDYIVAMGFVNGNKVLDAKRVLITKEPENNYRAIYLNINSIKGKEIETIDTQNKEYLLKFPKTWQGPEISELEEGMKIIVTGILDDKTFNLRSIFKIEE